MHIELTDHLRCPREHPEAFLVLLPDRMDRRRVAAGHLGCPVCGWSTAAQAMLGIDGPGGWVALAGAAGALAATLPVLLPGVAFVAVNPPVLTEPTETVSVLLSGEWSLKSHSMRGVILGVDASDWRDAALATT